MFRLVSPWKHINLQNSEMYDTWLKMRLPHMDIHMCEVARDGLSLPFEVKLCIFTDELDLDPLVSFQRSTGSPKLVSGQNIHVVVQIAEGYNGVWASHSIEQVIEQFDYSTLNILFSHLYSVGIN